MHRRGGKTVAAVAELVIRALYTTKKNAQYFYISPFLSQSKAIAWSYLVDMVDGIATDVKVSELSVTLPNGAKIRLMGSDNINALRGLYGDGVVIDEFAVCRPDLLQSVIMPVLLDRRGWLLLIGTSFGRLNQFYDYYKISKDNPEWFFMDKKWYDTNIIPEADLNNLRNAVSEAKFQQEFENSFSAELTGTYYASLINNAEREGRITNKDGKKPLYDPHLKVSAAFDIGRSDSTVIWFFQEAMDGIRLIKCYSNNGQPAEFYIKYLEEQKFSYNTVWLPHDAKAKTFATGKSALEQFIDAGIPVRITPSLSVQDGIEATRQMLRLCIIDYDTCSGGVEALRVYRRQWNEMKQVFSDKPLHDNSSDYADAGRYMAIVANVKKKAPPRPHQSLLSGKPSQMMTDYNLDKLYEDKKASAQSGVRKMRI